MNENVITSAPHDSHFPGGVRYSPGKFAAVALALVFVSYQFVGGGISLLLAGGHFTADNVSLARSATMAAQFIFLLLPTLWLMKRQHGAINSIISWRIPTIKEFILAVVGMVALLQMAEAYVYFQDMIPIPESIKPLVDKIKIMIEETYRILIASHSVPEMLFVLAVAALTPAICEEILFRGLIQKNLSLSTNNVKGFIVTGIIFGLYHLNPFLAVPLVALGIYFSFLRFRSGSILVPMAAHFINNGLSVVGVYLFGYDRSDIPAITSSDSSTTAVIGSFLLFTTIFIITIVTYRRVTDDLIQKKTSIGYGQGHIQ